VTWVQVFLFINSKCKRYFHNRLRPSKLDWTATYRKQHKKVRHASHRPVASQESAFVALRGLL